MRILRLSILSLLLISSPLSFAGAPTCHTHGGGNYCAYTGYVDRAYINSGGLFLLYFDTPLNLSVPSSVGFNASSTQAAAFPVSESDQFGYMLYSTALSALSENKRVTIQMRGTYGGYLKIDRIWIYRE